MAETPGSGLARDLRRWDLVALVINSVIGAGIFGLPSRVYALAGTYSLAAYLVSALAITLVVVCFAEVGSRFRKTGGPYLYARVAFGPLVGFQVGWLLWLARIAAFAALCNLALDYVAYFVPGVTSPVARVSLIVAIVAVLAAINVTGVRVTAGVTNILTIAKLVPLCLVAGAGLLFIDSQQFSFATPPGYGSFSQAALLVVFAYMGFEAVVIPTGEARDPARHLPFALLTGITVVATVYVLVQVVCIGTLPDLAGSARPLADVGRMIFGAPGASLLAAGAVVSIGGTMNAMMFASPRLLFAMAEHHDLPNWFGGVHARFRTPVAAIVVTAAAALGASLFSTFVSALAIAAVARLLAYVATCAGLLVLRRRLGVPPPAFVAPGGKLLPAGAVALSLWLLSSSTSREAVVVGLACLAGLLIYLPSTIRRGARQLNETG